MEKIRRVVTGHDDEGRAIFVSDEEVAATRVVLSDTEYVELWRGDETPQIPNAGVNGAKTTFFPEANGYRFFILAIPPETGPPGYEGIDIEAGLAEFEAKLPGILQWSELDNPGMHTTDTVDMEYVVSGEITLELDDGVEKVLKAGDSNIQNGTRHRWHNRGQEDAVVVVVMVGAAREK
jgi:mannose-6-phosphate isomerase-like protein (cupin superfamily)